MPIYASNNVYLRLNTTDVSSRLVAFRFEPTHTPTEITAGATTTHVQRAAGLDDARLEVTLAYDTAALPTYITLLRPGSVYDVEFGIEGSATGKPRHVQQFILVAAPLKISASKQQVEFDLSFKGVDAPTVNMLAGAVY